MDGLGRDNGTKPYWQQAAREAVDAALDSAEFDEVSGVIRLRDLDESDHMLGEFASLDDLWPCLEEIADSAWSDYAPFESGHPIFEPSTDGYVEDALNAHGVVDFFARMGPPSGAKEIVRASDLLERKGSSLLRTDICDIDEELVRYLAKHPKMMHELKPRKFEELVAELFRDKGYDVDLTPQTADGGFDVRAVQRTDVGTAMVLVECKRYAPSNKVSVGTVRGLFGVVEREDATRGLIATTSFFTKGAKAFQASMKFRLTLADFNDVTDWLASYKKRR